MRLESPSGLSITMLVDSTNLGGRELEMGEITFPAGSSGGAHQHGGVELLYVLQGRLGHVVNDSMSVLTPGMVGIVRPGDRVIHRVLSKEPVKALVIWAPAGEEGRLREAFRVVPIR